MSKPVIVSNTNSVSISGLSRLDLEPGVPVFCSDSNVANVDRAHLWSFVDIPFKSMATLSKANTPNCSFVPDVSGSYLIRCCVDGVEIDELILAMPVNGTGIRIPAYGETDQYRTVPPSRGWHGALSESMRALGDYWSRTLHVQHIDLDLKYLGTNWPHATDKTVAFGYTALPKRSVICFARATVYETAIGNDLEGCLIHVGTNEHAEHSLCFGLLGTTPPGTVVDTGSESPLHQGLQPTISVHLSGCTFGTLTAGRVGVDIFYRQE
jgi:hypothetical protein